MDKMDMMYGGFTEPRDANEDIQQKCNKIKPAAENMTGQNYGVFRADKYRSQVVRGVNYLIKVHVGCEHYVHLLVHEDLPGGGICLIGVQENKSKHDPLVPF